MRSSLKKTILMTTSWRWRWSVQVKRIGEDQMRAEEEKERDLQPHQNQIADILPEVIVINRILKDVV